MCVCVVCVCERERVCAAFNTTVCVSVPCIQYFTHLCPFLACTDWLPVRQFVCMCVCARACVCVCVRVCVCTVLSTALHPCSNFIYSLCDECVCMCVFCMCNSELSSAGQAQWPKHLNPGWISLRCTLCLVLVSDCYQHYVLNITHITACKSALKSWIKNGLNLKKGMIWFHEVQSQLLAKPKKKQKNNQGLREKQFYKFKDTKIQQSNLNDNECFMSTIV